MLYEKILISTCLIMKKQNCYISIDYENRLLLAHSFYLLFFHFCRFVPFVRPSAFIHSMCPSNFSLDPSDCLFCFLVKLLQFLTSLFLVISLHKISAHWLLLIGSLALPFFGIYWLFGHKKSWLRIDLAMCATMAIVFLTFAVVLFVGYFQKHPMEILLLMSAIASLFLFFLYSLNVLLCVRRLKKGRVDSFKNGKENHHFFVAATRSSRKSPLTLNKHESSQSVPEALREGQQHSISLANEMEVNDKRWRKIPIMKKENEKREERGGESVRRETRRVRIEKSGETEFGMDLAMWRSMKVEQEQQQMDNRRKIMEGLFNQQQRPARPKSETKTVRTSKPPLWIWQ